MRTRLLVVCSFAALGLLALACSGGKKPPPREPAVIETVSDAGTDADVAPEAPKSLFERLGGKEAIVQVVDSFTKNLAGNDVTKKRFAKLPKDRVEKFKANLVDQLCKETGGDCEYNGKGMKEAHKGLKITEAEWNAGVAALKAALEEHHVGEAEQGDLMALLAPMKDDIVEQKPTKK